MLSVTKEKYRLLRWQEEAPGVSHILFADESLLFIKAEEGQARSVKQALNTFQQGTSQFFRASLVDPLNLEE